MKKIPLTQGYFAIVDDDKYNDSYKVAIRIKHTRLQLESYKNPFLAFHIYRNSVLQCNE